MRARVHSWLGKTSLLLAFLALGGCGRDPDVATLEGKVTFGGQPISSDFVVTFYAPKLGIGATALIDGNGAFRVAGPIRRGEYLVMVDYPPPPPGSPGTTASKQRVPFHAKYKEERTTDLRIHVAAGRNQVELDLKP